MVPSHHMYRARQVVVPDEERLRAAYRYQLSVSCLKRTEHVGVNQGLVGILTLLVWE